MWDGWMRQNTTNPGDAEFFPTLQRQSLPCEGHWHAQRLLLLLPYATGFHKNDAESKNSRLKQWRRSRYGMLLVQWLWNLKSFNDGFPNMQLLGIPSA